MGKLFWLGVILSLALVTLPVWFPLTVARFHIQNTETLPIETMTAQGGASYTVENVTSVAIPIGSTLNGNLTIVGQSTVPTAQLFYIMTQAEFDSWKPNSGVPTTISDIATAKYTFDSIACKITYPFSFPSSSSTVYYFVYQQSVASGSYGYLSCAPPASSPGAPIAPFKYTPPRLNVFETQDSSSKVMSDYQTSAEVILGIASLVMYTGNEVGWRREKKRQTGS